MRWQLACANSTDRYVGTVLDDLESRPGSATSLLRTVIGLYLRGPNAQLTAGNLVVLMDALGVSAANTRTAVARVKLKGLIRSAQVAGAPGYVLDAAAEAMLARGDRRIFHPRTMHAGDHWCLISFSVPETERERRHQLRRRLSWIGCGTVAAGLWIAPDMLRNEVEQVFDELELRDRTTLFVTAAPLSGVPLATAISQWWDLPSIADLHSSFLFDTAAVPLQAVDTTAEAFSHFVHSIDSWRIIPYLDPGLPYELLPTNWPGLASSARFADIRRHFQQPAAEFFQQVSAETSTYESGLPDPAL